MKRMKRAWFLVVAASSALSCGGPPSWPPTLVDIEHLGAFEREARTAAQAIDQLKWYVDAYGGAGMSSPLLVQPDTSFKFNLSMTADEFFAAEKNEISGRAAGAVGSAQAIGVSVSASADVTGMQQYADALAQYRRNQGVIAQKQALLNDAAYRQYVAASQAAQLVTDPVARANAEADAARQYAQALSGPAADAANPPPTPPAPPALPGAPSIPNAAAGLLPGLAAPQGLYATGTPGVMGETRAAVLMAAGDVATHSMLAALLDPSKLASFSGKQILWGVSMVSVNPGWKTRKGYSADLQGDLSYEWAWARPEVRSAFIAQTNPRSPIEAHALAELQRCVVDSLPYPHPDDSLAELCKDGCKPPEPFDGTSLAPYIFRRVLDDQPVVAAASPMGDAQALDLQGANRTVRQTALQMAFALTTAGLNAQASSFLNFAKSRQLDVETRSNNVIVSAYSTTDGFFGFRFNPRLAADPAAGGESKVMQVPTFPTLLVIGMNSNELHARVLVNRGGGGIARCFVVEPKLRFHTAARWTRVGPQCQSPSAMARPCYGNELTEEELLQAAVAANEALRHAAKELNNRKALRDAAKQKPTVGATQGPAPCKAGTAGCPAAAGAGAALVSADLSDRYGADRDPSAGYLTTLSRRKDTQLALLGTSQSLWMPPDIIVPPPDKPRKPAITLASQTVLDLEYDAHGAIVPRTVKLTLVGDELDQIDTSKAASPDPADPANPAVSGLAAKYADKKLQLSFVVHAPGVYVFALPLKDGSGALATPALTVRAPHVVTVGHTVTNDKGVTTKDTLTFTPGTPSDVVKSEIEKAKVLPADLKVDVQAHTRTDTKAGK